MSVKYPNYVNLTSSSEEQPNERTPPQAPSKSISSKSTHYTSSSSPSESPTPTHVAPPPKLCFVIPIKLEPQELPQLQVSPNDPYVQTRDNWPPGPSNPSLPPHVSKPPLGFPNPPPEFEPLTSTQPCFFEYLHYELPEDVVSIIFGIILELQHDDSKEDPEEDPEEEPKEGDDEEEEIEVDDEENNSEVIDASRANYTVSQLALTFMEINDDKGLPLAKDPQPLKDFMKCSPISFRGNEGAVVMFAAATSMIGPNMVESQWQLRGIEVMTRITCVTGPWDGAQGKEQKERLRPNICDFGPENIKREVTSSEPTTLNKAV
ncbi:hypothetical protein Tco_0295088 [Tanacetum coccineum]